MSTRLRFRSISSISLRRLSSLAPTLACALGLPLLTVATASAAPAAPTVTAATAAETSVDLTWSLPPVTATSMVRAGAGYGHECTIDSTGVAWCVGNQGYGVLGNGSTTGDPTNVLATVTTAQRFNEIETARLHSCALTAAGAAYCWGTQAGGRLGNGESSDSSAVPVAVSGGHTFSSISAHEDHTCALTTANAAYCWGVGSDSRQGNGAGARQLTPEAVLGGHSFQRIATGDRHSCGIDTANDAWCWGHRQFGQLGDGGAVAGTQDTPIAVSGGLKFTEIDAGGVMTCALTAAGAAYCWGQNGNGELGSGSTDPTGSNVPVAVSGGHTFTQISTGDRFVCALDTAGAAWCWGRGAYVGNGSDNFSEFNVPTQVSGGHTFTRIKSGILKTCAIDDSSRVWCWGTLAKGAPAPDGTFHAVPAQLFDPNDPDDYKVETSADGTTWTTATASTGGTARTYSVTGLTAGTAYYFRVTGSSGGTLGTASAAYGPVTTTSPTPTAPPTPVPTLPLGGLLGVGLLVAGLGGRRLRQAWRR